MEYEQEVQAESIEREAHEVVPQREHVKEISWEVARTKEAWAQGGVQDQDQAGNKKILGHWSTYSSITKGKLRNMRYRILFYQQFVYSLELYALSVLIWAVRYER